MKKNLKREIRIMGSGPAGLSAGLGLSLSGIKSKIYEKNKEIGINVGDNIQAIRSHGTDANIIKKFKEAGLNLRWFDEIFKIKKIYPSGRCIDYVSKKPIFLTFKRGNVKNSLEYQIASQYTQNGGEIILGERPTFAESNIIACGTRFEPCGTGYGKVFNFRMKKKEIIFIIRNGELHNGYLTLIPYKNQVSIEICAFDYLRFNEIRNIFDKVINENQYIKNISDDGCFLNEYFGYGYYNIPKSAIFGKKIFVGGAAGFVDAARGFGVKYALLSGLLASKSVSEEKNYDKLWKGEFESELIRAFKRRLLLNKNLDMTTYPNCNKIFKSKTINIEKYAKTESPRKNNISDLMFYRNLKRWRKKYNFKKIGKEYFI